EAQRLLQDEERTLRGELDELRRKSAADLEHLRLELAKAREEKVVATTSAGLTAAEKLAEADLTIESLKRELEAARAKAATALNEPRAKALEDQLTTITLRAEKAEKELQGAQIRAQGAERNLQHANMQAAKAETRAAELKGKLDDAAAERSKLAA